MKERFFISKNKIEKINKEYSFDINEFYGKFYNSLNCVIYCGGHIIDDNIYWYIINNNENLQIMKNQKINGGHDSLYIDITRALKEYEFICEISKEDFIKKVNYFIK